MAWESLPESRQLQVREPEELVRPVEDLDEEKRSSSRACMRLAFVLGLMKGACGKMGGSGEGGSDCAEAEGALPFMLDTVVLRLGACFLLENSLSNLSNPYPYPLAMVGGTPGGLLRT